MNTGHTISPLDDKGLRQFAFVTGAIVAALFGLVLPLLFDRVLPLWPWILLIVLAGLGLVAPKVLKPVYFVWMRFGLLVSRVTTPLILGIVFFFVITPMALFKKIFGRDAMTRTFDSGATSYRVHSVHKNKNNLERPF